VTNTLNGAAIGMFGPFLTYWFYRRFDVGPAEVGVLFAIINVATMASSLSAAAWARRWGLVRTVSVVRVLQSLLIIPMVLSPNFALAGSWFLVRMLIQRIGLPLRQSYVVGLADESERASVTALSNLPSQVAMSLSPLLTGYLFAEADLLIPFEIAAVLQLANAFTFWGFFRHHPPEEESVSRTVPPIQPEHTD
jgi:MFS family permease